MTTRSLLRGLAGSALTAVALLGAAGSASAGHLQGGSITAAVTDSGRLQGTLVYGQVNACVVGDQLSLPMTITSPTSQTAQVNVAMTAKRCIPGASTFSGGFDVPLDTSTFSNGAPDGTYELVQSTSARIGGIRNLSSSGAVTVTTQVRKVSGRSTSAPKFNSNVANGVAIGAEYRQNLNAVDPDGGAVTYQTRIKPGDPDAPDTDIIALDASTGKVSIPASVTAGFSGGWYYVYKVRATDAQGDFAERDVLLKVASTNTQPKFEGLQPRYTLAPGGTLSIPVKAVDAESADTVTIAAGELPTWATLTSTPGNPGTATLALNPPAGVTGTFGINLDAVDDSSDVALTDAAYTEIVVGNTELAAPAITSAPAAKHLSTTASFSFTGAAGATFECRVDAAAFAACASPHTASGLKTGAHTFDVRQSEGGRVSPVATAKFTVIGLSLTTERGDVSYTNATPVLPNAVNPKTGKTAIECNLSGVTNCVVNVYVTVKGKKVLVGAGTATATGNTEGVSVPVTLNARGRKLVSRSGGIKLTIELAASAQGTTVNLSSSARLLPSATTTLARTGLKGTALRRYQRSLKRELADAKSVTCVGRADAARAFCKQIAGFDGKAKLKVKGVKPRAGGARVKLEITY